MTTAACMVGFEDGEEHWEGHQEEHWESHQGGPGHDSEGHGHYPEDEAPAGPARWDEPLEPFRSSGEHPADLDQTRDDDRPGQVPYSPALTPGDTEPTAQIPTESDPEPLGECETSADCPDGQSCRGEEGCDAVWTCQPQAPCTIDLLPFCGCDGVTFSGSSTCPARPYAYVGPCAP